jgi:hypothetical protein
MHCQGRIEPYPTIHWICGLLWLNSGYDSWYRSRQRATGRDTFFATSRYPPIRNTVLTVLLNGRGAGARTPDPRIKSPLLYQLSYTSVYGNWITT